MKIKRLMLLVLASMAMGAMSGCGKQETPEPEPTPVVVEKVTISFDANGGTGTMAAVQIDKGSDYVLPASTFVAPFDHHFKNWEVGGTAYQVGAKLTAVAANTTVKAVWELDALPAEYDLLGHWEGNTAEEIFSVTQTAAGATQITYADATGEDSGGWQYVKRSFLYEATRVARFTEYKKIIFTGSMTKTSGTNIVMIKLQNKDLSGVMERRFIFGEEARTYELSLSLVENWNNLEGIYFFVNRNTNESGSGVMTFTKFALSKEEVNEANNIAPGTPAVPQGTAYFNELADEQNVMYHWGYSSEGHIVTEEVSGGYKFSWQGAKAEWEWVSSVITDGSAALANSGFQRVVFNVTGTAGKTAVFKFENKVGNRQAREVTVTFTGEAQVVEVNIKPLLVADNTSFMAMIMPDGGQANVADAGEIVLTRCYLDKNEVYDPYANIAKFPQIWLDKVKEKDNCYTVVENEQTHTLTVQYSKAAGGWESMKLRGKINDAWFGPENYRLVVADIVSTADVKVLFKAFNAHEHWIELEADVKQHIEYEVPADKVNWDENFILFVGTEGDTALSGTVTIEGLRLARITANADNGNGVVRLDKVNNAGIYQVSHNDSDDLVLGYNKSEGFADKQYASAELTVSARNAEALTTIKGKLISTVDTHVILKPADSNDNEKKIALTANTPVDVEEAAKLNDEWVGKVTVIVCYENDDAKVGQVTFQDLRLTDGTHDIGARLALPDGEFHGIAKAAGANAAVPVDVYFGGAMPEFYLNAQKHPVESWKFNERTGLITFKFVEQSPLGTVTAVYDPAAKSISKMSGVALSQIADASFPIVLNGDAIFYDCEGTTAELQAEFKRRYWRTSDSGWGVDSSNTDRITSVENGKVGKGLTLRTVPGTGDRLALNHNGDIQTGGKVAKSLSFWVYNPSDADATLRLWIYKASNSFDEPRAEIGSVTAKAGAWTYCQCGFAQATIYNFQIANFACGGNALVFDSICIF